MKGRSYGVRDITDGTSNTVAFGEWKTGSGVVNTLTMPTDIIFPGSLPAGTARNNGTLTMPNPILVASFPSWLAQCTASFSAPGSRMSKTPTLGQNWAFGLVGYTMGNLLLAPNPRYPNCNGHQAGTIQWPSMLGLASNHPGGANVLMGDGSVRFLKDSTNMQTIWALGSRAGGEIVSADAY